MYYEPSTKHNWLACMLRSKSYKWLCHIYIYIYITFLCSYLVWGDMMTTNYVHDIEYNAVWNISAAGNVHLQQCHQPCSTHLIDWRTVSLCSAAFTRIFSSLMSLFSRSILALKYLKSRFLIMLSPTKETKNKILLESTQKLTKYMGIKVPLQPNLNSVLFFIIMQGKVLNNIFLYSWVKILKLWSAIKTPCTRDLATNSKGLVPVFSKIPWIHYEFPLKLSRTTIIISYNLTFKWLVQQ